MKIYVGEKLFEIPNEVLKKVSSYFEVLFSELFVDFEENVKNEIHVGLLDPQAFACIFKYLSDGVISISTEKAFDVYLACLYLQLKEDVLQTFATNIGYQLCYGNPWELLNELDYWRDEVLTYEIIEYLTINIETAVDDPQFQTISAELVKKLLKSDLYYTKRNFPLRLIAKWLSYDVERKNEVDSLIHCLTSREQNLKKFEVSQWNEEEIRESLEEELLLVKTRRSDKLYAWYGKPFQPWFTMIGQGIVDFFHLSPIQWTPLDHPRLKFNHEIIGARSARENSLVYMFLDHQEANNEYTEFMVYNYYSREYTHLRQPWRPYLENDTYEHATIINGSLFLCSGTNIQTYDSTMNVWTQIPYEQSGNRYPVYTSDGRLLYALGDQGNCANRSARHCVEFYDQRSSRWSQLPAFPDRNERIISCATFAEDIIYTLSGDTMECLDLRAGKWRMLNKPCVENHGIRYLMQCGYRQVCGVNDVGDLFKFIMKYDYWMGLKLACKGLGFKVQPVNCLDYYLSPSWI